MIGQDHLHIIEKGVVQEQDFNVSASKQTKSFLFEISDSNHLITDARKP